MTPEPGNMAAVRRKRLEYSSTGDMTHLAESVRLGRSLLARLAAEGSDGALQGAAANELAASLGALYEATGDMRHLDEQLALLDQALEMLPPGDPNLAPVHTNIAGGRVRRFARLGREAEADLAIAIAEARLGITSSRSDDPNLAVRHSNLVGVLRMRYDLTGDPAALDESITAGQAAVAAIRPETHDQAMILASLAGSLGQRGLRRTSLSDFEESIAFARRAFAVAPLNSPGRYAASSILAATLRAKAQITGDLGSLSEAIALHRENADLVPSQQAEYALHVAHLAASLLVRYEWQEDVADLDAADDAAQRVLKSGHVMFAAQAWSLLANCWRHRVGELVAAGDRAGAEDAATRAVEAARESLTAPSGSERSSNLIVYCNTLASRYELTGRAAHRDEALAAYRDAIESLGAGTDGGQLAMVNLGIALLRHDRGAPASRSDIVAAMGLFREVLTAAETDGERWGNACVGLIRAQTQLFLVAPGEVDADEVSRLYQRATEAAGILARRRAAAGKAAGTLLLGTGRAEPAARILTDVLGQLPAVAWRGTHRRTRESALAGFSELGCDAAAAHLLAGHADPAAAVRAAEAVERGRGVLWADLLQLRRGDAGLWETQPELAVRLRGLAAVLDTPEETLDSGLGDSRGIDQRMAAAAKWDEAVAEVRCANPDFLRPVQLSKLLPAAERGPVVIVNVSQFRCDALIVSTTGVRAVPLPSLSAGDVDRHVDRYLVAYARLTAMDEGQAVGASDIRALDATLSEVLEWLWDSVTEPVLTALGIDGSPSPGQPWPRIWWCPTGLLSLLPLHAAGYHAADYRGASAPEHAPPRTVLDRVISSYTPTLGVLADASRRDGSEDADDATLLFVGLPSTPGASSLPGVDRDRDYIVGKLGSHCHVVCGESATVAAVRAELPSHRWVHFDCHGYQDLEAPSKGGLVLWDGMLDVAGLSAQGQPGEFAFLAACQTAVGGTVLPNEAISLAAAVHFAGYRHVVATLSYAYDYAAAAATAMIYDDLTASGRLSPSRSAHALHAAITKLRDSRRASPSWWTPFIHIGP